MKSEYISCSADLASYIDENKSCIYVRAEVNGKWGSYALTELPAARAIEKAMAFVMDGRIPVVLKEDV